MTILKLSNQWLEQLRAHLPAAGLARPMLRRATAGGNRARLVAA
jgi:hypothetical protein